jgi:hypothetical protein
MQLVGFYDNMTPMCVDCDDGNSDTAIFTGDEADTPTHCEECGVLIPHALTSDGYDYVGDKILEGFHAGVQNPVTVQWIDYYGGEMDDEHVHGLDRDTVIDLYKLMPYASAWIDTDREDLRRHARLVDWID